MATAPRRSVLPPTDAVWIYPNTGGPTEIFRNFMVAFSSFNFGPLTSAANDAEAAKAGVPVNTLYQANGVVRIRIS